MLFCSLALERKWGLIFAETRQKMQRMNRRRPSPTTTPANNISSELLAPAPCGLWLDWVNSRKIWLIWERFAFGGSKIFSGWFDVLWLYVFGLFEIVRSMRRQKWKSSSPFLFSRVLPVSLGGFPILIVFNLVGLPCFCVFLFNFNYDITSLNVRSFASRRCSFANDL